MKEASTRLWKSKKIESSPALTAAFRSPYLTAAPKLVSAIAILSGFFTTIQSLKIVTRSASVTLLVKKQSKCFLNSFLN